VHRTNLQLALAHEHLVQLRKPLFALVALELGPELQVLVDQREGLGVVFWELNLFPKLLGQMSTLYCLEIQVAVTLVLAYSSVARIGEGTAMAIAEACEVVVIAAESLCGGLSLESAVAIVDDLPNNVVLNHFI
jgi:hypothetical protein